MPGILKRLLPKRGDESAQQAGDAQDLRGTPGLSGVGDAVCRAAEPRQLGDGRDAGAVESCDDAPAARLSQVVRQLEHELQHVRDVWRERWERDAVRLACQIAARCVRETPLDTAALAQRLVEESLRGMRLDASCEVRLHPEDFRELAAGPSPGAGVTLLPDARVERGGCIVRTPDGTIDQTLDAQLRRVEQELLGL